MDSWDPEADRRRVECVHVGPAELRQGDRVRLRPRGRADIMDLALAGMTATIESIEQDYEGRVYLAVTVDDDPGKDLGALRQPGHRFFFQPEEVEPLAVRRPHDGPLPVRPGPEPLHGAGLRRPACSRSSATARPSPSATSRGDADFERGRDDGPGARPDRPRRLARTARTRSAPPTAARSRAGCGATCWRRRPTPRSRFEADEVAGRPDRPGPLPAPHRRPAVAARRHPAPAGRRELQVFDDGLRLRGECPLRLSDYRIRPVTALGGTIRLKDELKLSFDLVGLPEGS